ncbi:MAG: alpha/beta hydrolase-fold protein [Chitinophagales bacterium]|nr:esterase [Bacteroidota bacterium]MCB9044275.1 esterase [Chitinophagales bacterium]
MKFLYRYLLVFLPIMLSAQNELQIPLAGKIDRIENFPSAFVAARNVDVWLPENYDGKKKFAVLYMHDGQMLFDSTHTWNNQSWDVDDIATKLLQSQKIRNFIVVGIWNIPEIRHTNYFPKKPFESLSKAEKEAISHQLAEKGRTTTAFQPNSDDYLKFITQELKPYIDQHYSVHTNRKNTFIAGSSMGGLISMYAICEYPHIFGGAACLSTHWVGTFSLENNPIPQAFFHYLDQNLPKASTHKFYFDCGDQTLDALYPPLQQQVDSIMQKHAYTHKNWQTRYFEGKDHSENAWKERLDIPILFLFAK